LVPEFRHNLTDTHTFPEGFYVIISDVSATTVGKVCTACNAQIK